MRDSLGTFGHARGEFGHASFDTLESGCELIWNFRSDRARFLAHIAELFLHLAQGVGVAAVSFGDLIDDRMQQTL